MRYRAVMIDETGCEFGADVEALDKSEAREQLRDRYPESRIDQLESDTEVEARWERQYQRICDAQDAQWEWED